MFTLASVTPAVMSAVTHDDELCDSRDACLELVDEKKMVETCQISQGARAGYACDYTCKRQPCGCNEVRETCRGHQKLGQNVANEPIQRIGKHHVGRILSDAYSKGLVRGVNARFNSDCCSSLS